MISKEKKAAIIAEYGRKPGDTCICRDDCCGQKEEANGFFLPRAVVSELRSLLSA